MDIKTIPLSDCDLKFSDGAARGFTGYASVFGGVDSYGDTIHPGAFRAAIGEGSWVKMYYNHGWRRDELPIGKMFVQEDVRGLRVSRSELTANVRQADDVYNALLHGTVDGLSIAYQITAAGYVKKADRGKDIHAIKLLREVSVVDDPADASALVDSVKSAIDDATSIKEIETVLRDAGRFSRADACALVARIKALAHGDRDAEPNASEIEALFRRYA